MKILFISSAAISGVVSFLIVNALREHEQKKFDTKMDTVDRWMKQHPLR